MTHPTLTPSPHHADVAATTDDDAPRMFLENTQLVADTSQPVARAHLGRRATAALWGLRAFAPIISFMVIYSFLRQLR